MLNYSSSNPPPKSRISNKRVAFPLAQNTTKPTLSDITQLPIATNENTSENQSSSWNPEKHVAQPINNFEKQPPK